MLEELTLIIDSYLHDLEEVSKQLDNSPYRKMHDVQLLITKINLQISMLQSTSHTLLKYSEGKDSGLVRIKSYLTNTFSALIKYAYRVLHIKNYIQSTGATEQNEGRLRNKLQLIRQIEEEMMQYWYHDSLSDPKSINFSPILQSQKQPPMLNEFLSQRSLKGLAKYCLHKYFLAIRMISYKMYYRYVGHSHHKLNENLETLHSEQYQLRKELAQLRNTNKTLLMEYKNLQKYLSEIRKINYLTSKRYFITDYSVYINN